MAANVEVDVVRSPADFLRLVVAVGALIAFVIVEWLFGTAIVGFVHDLLRGLDALDTDFMTVVVAVVRVATVAFLAAGLVVAVARGRWRLVVTVTVAAAIGVVLFAVVDHWIDAQRAALVALSDVAGPITDQGAPTGPGLAITAAVVTAAAPWLSRRYRRLGWVLALALAGTRFLAAPLSGASLAAMLSGWTGGAIAVLALGAPSVRPAKEAVLAGLRAVGVEVATLEQASVDARGSTPYLGETAQGRKLFVKVLGRNERDADLLFRLYRFVVRRNRGDERPFSTLRRAVEHEAFASLAVRDLGVRTPALEGFATADPDGFVLAYAAVSGRSLDRVDETGMTDAVLAGVWEQLAMLRRHRVAHRDLRLANLFLGAEGSVWLIDFGFAELAASDLLLATDLAELVASLSATVGPQRVVTSGLAAVGPDALRSALPRLRPALLSGATRTALKERPHLLAEIRSQLTGTTTIPVPLAPAVGER